MSSNLTKSLKGASSYMGTVGMLRFLSSRLRIDSLVGASQHFAIETRLVKTYFSLFTTRMLAEPTDSYILLMT